MANITAKDVQALRAKTGIGMMECKKALVEANGDPEEAIKILRKRGELKADAKAATRIAADGIVDIMKDGDVTAIVEVNSETDFVAKNASFQEFVKNILKTIIANRPANVEELLAATYLESDVTVEAKLKEMIFVIGCRGRDLLEIVFGKCTGSSTFHLLEIVFTTNIAHKYQAFDGFYIRTRCNHINRNGNTGIIVVTERT